MIYRQIGSTTYCLNTAYQVGIQNNTSLTTSWGRTAVQQAYECTAFL